MNEIKTWQERGVYANDAKPEGAAEIAMCEEIAELRAALSARATPAQPVPEISYAISVKETGADLVINRIDGDITTVLHSEFHPMGDTYGLLLEAPEDEEPSPSSVGAAIRALPLPEPFNPVANQWSFSDLEQGEFYLSQDLRALLSEAAALAEQVQEQHWLPIESAPKDQRVLLWFPIFGNGSHVEFGKWDAQPHNKKPNPYWSGDMERTFGVNWYREYQPTHYMLPPAAPSIAQDGQKSEGV